MCYGDYPSNYRTAPPHPDCNCATCKKARERSYIPARDYFSEAKKRTAHLKSLKSVSRAYRKLAVRDLKQKAMAQRDLRRMQDLYIAGSNSRGD